MSEKETSSREASLNALYPIQRVQIGDHGNVPAPLVRISTCGGMTIEVLHEVVNTDPAQGRYIVVTPQQRRKGSTTGRILLSVLVSLPGHYAAKGWLTEKLCRSKNDEDDETDWGGMVRVDNIVTLLRGLLCPPGIPGEKEVRKTLVSYVSNRFESGPGYQLAAAPLLWIDVDVIEAAVKQACQLEQSGENALPSWEQAYTLASKGSYLPDERYSDWARDKRGEVDGYLRQVVHALHRLYLARDGEAGEEQALLLLRSYWQSHPTDEDGLRPLMELLGKRGCVQEADEYYYRLCQELELEGCTPSLRTQQTAQNVRAGQSTSLHRVEAVLPLKVASASSLYQQDEAQTSFSPLTIQDIMGIVGESDKENDQNMNPLRRATTIGILSLLGRNLSPEWWERLAHPRPSAMNTEAFTYFQQLLEIGWGLSNTGELHAAEQVVMSFLPRIFQLAPHQKEAASIAAEGLRLRGILAAHKLRIADKLTFSLQAVEYARQASDPNIIVAELTELAAAFEYAQQLENSFRTHQEALPLVEQASPLIRSRFYGRSAIAFARKGRIKEALSYIDLAYDNLPEHPENEQNFLSSDHGSYKLARHKGLMYLSMGKLAESEKAFESIEYCYSTVIPERSRLEIVNDRGRVAVLSNDLTKYAKCLEEGIVGSILLKSQKRFDEALTIYQQEMPKSWQNEQPIKQIVERFHL